jgi:hypothetical protein
MKPSDLGTYADRSTRPMRSDQRNQAKLLLCSPLCSTDPQAPQKLFPSPIQRMPKIHSSAALESSVAGEWAEVSGSMQASMSGDPAAASVARAGLPRFGSGSWVRIRSVPVWL